jgi:plasmid stability protein
MGAITIRNLDDAVVAAIKRRAADNGVSMEEEVRQILSSLYSDEMQKKGQDWARQQLECLKRGELPKGDGDTVQLIREMRRDRTDRVLRAAEGRRGSRG